jgi:hypothetical protein
MIDSTGSSHVLAGLLEVETSEPGDWDTSALADWPNIPTAATAPISSAELPATGFDQAR